MAAAPRLVVGESPLASPELALVDAALATELRRSLCPVEDSSMRPRERFEEAPPAFEDDTPVQREVADEGGHAEAGDADQLHDYIVDSIEHTPAQSQRTSSHYPVLPAPEVERYEEAIEETDAVLRRIRTRLTDESPASDESPAPERKLRRRFILGSGAGAVCVLGLGAVDVQLQVAQLPSWLGF
jgi:hypothetical protein